MRTQQEITNRLIDLKQNYDVMPANHSLKEATLIEITILDWVLGGNGISAPCGKI